MAQYRIMQSKTMAYEYYAQKKNLFGLWNTIRRAHFLRTAQEAIEDDIEKNNGGWKQIYETEG